VVHDSPCNVELHSESDFLHLPLFRQFFREPEPIIASASYLSAARIGQEPNPDADIGVGP